MAIFFQNGECDSASTIWPSARSLSATIAFARAVTRARRRACDRSAAGARPGWASCPPLPLLELLQEDLRTHDVRNGCRVRRIVAREHLVERRERRRDRPLVGEVVAVAPPFEQPLALPAARSRAAGRRTRRRRARSCPRASARSQRKPVFAYAIGIGAVERVAAADVAGPQRVARLARLRHPLVAVAGVAAGRVEVVEQHELGRPACDGSARRPRRTSRTTARRCRAADRRTADRRCGSP